MGRQRLVYKKDASTWKSKDGSLEAEGDWRTKVKHVLLVANNRASKFKRGQCKVHNVTC